jgi:hypothetical protein
MTMPEHWTDEHLDDLAREALATTEPRESDEAFAARLMHRLRVEDALTPSAGRRQPMILWAGMTGLAAAVCLLLVVVFQQTVPVAPRPNFHSELARLVSTHEGRPMVARATEDSLLFVASMSPAPEDGPIAPEPERIRILAPGEEAAPNEIGWLRLERTGPRS